ncbi:ATP/GTP-binding protein [Xylaria telfairii]|nr:ATP/GTP-binding protein [Xylaria telfairii]
MVNKMDDIIARLYPQISRAEVDPRPVVLMTCGIAGSGKSTFSKTFVSAHPNFDRLFFDGILAEQHGIFGVDYPREKYSMSQEETAQECKVRLTRLLTDGDRDVVYDRAFWNKADRDEAKKQIEALGARWGLVYLKPPATLWRRIVERREVQLNADSAYLITPDILDMYWDGFEKPVDEGEIVIDTHGVLNEASG